MPPYKPVALRLADLSFPDPNSGCWYWCGHLDQDGYGKFGGGKTSAPATTTAHKASYLEFIGPVGAGLEIDHKCNNRACINPAHLQAITHAENVRRADHKTNHPNRVKTHCKRGHAFSFENTLIEKWRHLEMRKCKICRVEKERRRTIRRRTGI